MLHPSVSSAGAHHDEAASCPSTAVGQHCRPLGQHPVGPGGSCGQRPLMALFSSACGGLFLQLASYTCLQPAILPTPPAEAYLTSDAAVMVQRHCNVFLLLPLE